MVEFGQRLRALRKEKGLTQKQLAELIRVQGSMISFYEVGDRFPSPEIIIKLAQVLHVSTDYLLGVEEKETADISGLSEKDKQIIRELIDRLRKNKGL